MLQRGKVLQTKVRAGICEITKLGRPLPSDVLFLRCYTNLRVAGAGGPRACGREGRPAPRTTSHLVISSQQMEKHKQLSVFTLQQ